MFRNRFRHVPLLSVAACAVLASLLLQGGETVAVGLGLSVSPLLVCLRKGQG